MIIKFAGRFVGELLDETSSMQTRARYELNEKPMQTRRISFIRKAAF